MKFFKRTDIIVIGILILIGILGFVVYKFSFSNKPCVAEIFYYSKLVKTVDLTKKVDYTFSIPEKENIVFHVFKDGAISFEKSNCKDKICVNSGKLNTVGESAACLPNGIVLKIVSKNWQSNNDIDIIAGK